MQIAIAHYHLNRGGVTQVIVNHLRSLSATMDDGGPLRVALLYGGRRRDWPAEEIAGLDGVEATLCEVPLLEYDSDAADHPAELLRQLTAAMASVGMTPTNSVLHIHNHALGKNRALPGAVDRLARAGQSLLLQIHDFAEDSRPDNYRALASSLAPEQPDRLASILYPQSPAIHYALLNRRDLSIMRRAGVPEQRLHALPNPVADFHDLPNRGAARDRLRRVFGLTRDVRVPGVPGAWYSAEEPGGNAALVGGGRSDRHASGADVAAVEPRRGASVPDLEGSVRNAGCRSSSRWELKVDCRLARTWSRLTG